MSVNSGPIALHPVAPLSGPAPATGKSATGSGKVALTFGRYSVLRKISEGGMAELFLARQSGIEGFEKLVVLKRIRKALSHDRQYVAMLLNEAKVAARLNHPHLVATFDLGKMDEQYFIAMEFLHGENLLALMARACAEKTRLPLALACRVVASVLDGLAYAHHQSGLAGLVHRDVSPQNVIVTYAGGVKLIDFGIAKATQSAHPDLTVAGQVKGRFSYMSPEQMRRQPLDGRSDVFSTGVLLWELCAWRTLFRRRTPLETMSALLREPIPAPSTVNPEVPPELDRIVLRALERDREARYPTAQAMRDDLEAFLRDKGWAADAGALERFIRGAYADKLREQEETMRAAGQPSLEDYLLALDPERELPLSMRNDTVDTEQQFLHFDEATTATHSVATLPGYVAPRAAREEDHTVEDLRLPVHDERSQAPTDKVPAFAARTVRPQFLVGALSLGLILFALLIAWSSAI
jgi:serine/threonine-protein kinase